MRNNSTRGVHRGPGLGPGGDTGGPGLGPGADTGGPVLGPGADTGGSGLGPECSNLYIITHFMVYSK